MNIDIRKYSNIRIFVKLCVICVDRESGFRSKGHLFKLPQTQQFIMKYVKTQQSQYVKIQQSIMKYVKRQIVNI